MKALEHVALMQHDLANYNSLMNYISFLLATFGSQCEKPQTRNKLENLRNRLLPFIIL